MSLLPTTPAVLPVGEVKLQHVEMKRQGSWVLGLST